MEKYYCDHCCNLFEHKGECPKCQAPLTRKIKIDVQYQAHSNEHHSN